MIGALHCASRQASRNIDIYSREEKPRPSLRMFAIKICRAQIKVRLIFRDFAGLRKPQGAV